MDSFETLSDDCLNTQQIWTLSGPVSARTSAVLLTSEDDSLVAFLFVLLSCIEDIMSLPRGNMDGMRSHFAFHHLVSDPDISESASGHNQIVASTRSISVEIFLFNAPFLEEAGSWRRSRDVASWRYMVRGYGVTKNC